jgi:hypothetical protein
LSHLRALNPERSSPDGVSTQQHLPAQQLKILKVAEESERDWLWNLAFTHDDAGDQP